MSSRTLAPSSTAKSSYDTSKSTSDSDAITTTYSTSRPGATSSSTNTPSSFYASIPTEFMGQGGTIQNYGSQVFNLNDLPPSAHAYLSQLPANWTQNASPEQIQGLLNELQNFHSNYAQATTINADYNVNYEPVVSAVTYLTEANYADGVQPIPARSQPTRTASTIPSAPESEWWDAIDIPQLTAAKEALGRGYNLVSTYSTPFESEEALAAFGEGALSALGEGAATFGLEGVAAGAAEFLGGAAAVGGFIAGGEIIAGAALLGFGLYEAYKGLGGDASSTIDSLSNTAASAFAGVEGAQQTFQQVQGYISTAQDYIRQAEDFTASVESWFGGP